MLFHKKFHHGEEMFIWYPGTQKRTPYKRSAIFVLMDEVNEANVDALLHSADLQTLGMDGEFLIGIPVPPAGGWKNAPLDCFLPFRDGIRKPDDEPLPVNSFGIPTMEAMTMTWHPMLDVHYMLAMGDGAEFALRLASEKPEWIAAMWVIGGKLSANMQPVAPMPIWLSSSDENTIRRFETVNECDVADGSCSYCSRNPNQRVMSDDLTAPDAASARRVWNELFGKVRRVNTCEHGDITDRLIDSRKLFECFVEDERLDGTPHTWFTHVPSSIGANEKLPLVCFYHGGSDNPAEAAEMVRLHELGEKEHFITVYPWGTNRCGWNSSMDPDDVDDVAFCADLIRYMIRNYPVDEQRVYVTGFSNGAAMAQAVALVHPEMIAACFHIDSNWPGKYGGYAPLDYNDVIPFAIAMQRKEAYDYLMPCWYTYGSRERSYPVWKDSTQQHQYDFWKQYNHIAIKPTPAQGEEPLCGAGVPGDVVEKVIPSEMYPGHWYDVNRFFDEQGRNLYNYVVMHNKGHEIAQKDAELGWNYVRQFRRLPDGSLGQVEK